MTESLRDGAPQPPLRARLHRYKLTTAEFALLTAMCEHSSDGSVIRPSVPRLAAYAKLSVKQVQRMIHGYDDPRKGHVAGLVERGILTQLAAKTRKPAIYRLNEDALLLDPRMRTYLGEQDQPLLPGILKPPKKGASPRPVSDSPGVTVTPPPRHGDTTPPSPCPVDPVTVTPYSKAFNSKAEDSTAVTLDRALLWAEHNSYAYRQFCRELTSVEEASVGSHEPNYERTVQRAALRSGVPDHLAFVLAGVKQ